MTDSTVIDVSILIISYNTRALTLEAISSAVRETVQSSYEFIVADNASHDGSAQAIAQHPAKPQLITLSENIGFARANNLAAKHARGRYILLLNPDTVVLDGAIDALVDFADANPDAQIWGGRTTFADGSLNPASCWGRMTLWNQVCRVTGLTALLPQYEMFNGETFGGWKRDSVRHVDIVSGCFFLIDRSVWEAHNGFDPLFYMYGEEADLCLRAAKTGAKPMITPTATIIHLGGASETARTAKMTKLLSAKASLIERHWHPLLSPIGKALQAFWPLSRAIALSVAGSLTRSEARLQTARTWYEIWTLRKGWMHGYPEHAEDNTLGAALASIKLTSAA
jgi:N-acetylglucosaminyl-diphospho-decaprenol L-rhamnosyltransferase